MIHGVVERIERAAAFIRGHGYGSTVRREVDLAVRLLGRAPELAIDVGANIGDYSAELRRQSPGCEIHAFEPAATNLERLRSRFKGDTRIHVVSRALSDAAGSGTLFSDTPGSGLGSLGRRDLAHLGIPFEIAETVDMVRFEEYWRGYLESRVIDILKLDIEGHELAALTGCGAALDRCRLIQFEFGGCHVDSRTFFRDFWRLFSSRGFQLHCITPIGLRPILMYAQGDESFIIANYIAVNGRLSTLL